MELRSGQDAHILMNLLGYTIATISLTTGYHVIPPLIIKTLSLNSPPHLQASMHQSPFTSMQYTQPLYTHTNFQFQFQSHLTSPLASTQPHLTSFLASTQFRQLHSHTSTCSLSNYQSLLSMDQTYGMVSQIAYQKRYLFAKNPMQICSPLVRLMK